MQPRLTIDFESRSACPIKTAGTWRYSIDPSTEILCLAFRLPGWAEGRTGLWHPAFPHLDIDENQFGSTDDLSELLDYLLSDGIVEAHSAWFERSMWQNILAPQHGFPAIASTRWRCSAAKAASHALPRGLDDALAALKLSVRKDAEGEKVMKKMAKPRHPRKAEREAWEKAHGNTNYPRLYWESLELLQRLFTYCRIDVLAEEALSGAVPDLSASETQVYLLDQTLNERGFRLDAEAVSTALALIHDEQKRGMVELAELTEGKVKKATQRDQMLEWLASEGCELPNTQKETLAGVLAEAPLTATARRGIELMVMLGKSSTAKYRTMQAQMSPVDHRVRGGLLFHGASTGRWSGSGVQPHNFPKGNIKTTDDMSATWELLKDQERDDFAYMGTTVLAVLSSALRGVIVPAPGNQLYVADYASIEARGLLWLVDDDSGMDIFREGRDPYLDMAETIFDRALTKADTFERSIGKVAILGLGYQMGWSKFIDTCLLMAGVVIDEEMSRRVVDAYRSKYYLVKEEWYGQEKAAIKATQYRGQRVVCGRVTWQVIGRFLYCTLPSGRRLAYPDPQVRDRAMPWGDVKPSLTFMGINTYTRQWQRQVTYGGMLVENIVQAISRDIMAEALLRCEASQVYIPILSVHDEVLAEARIGAGSVKEFETLVAQCPLWATDCPISAEGWSGSRYRK